MEPLTDLGFSLFSSPTTVVGVVVLLMILYVVSVGSSSSEAGKEPPGPKPLPLLGNLLQLDLQRPYKTLCQLSKKYGSIFTVYFGPKKVVVLSGYRTVKEALVSYADEFGEREITPILEDINRGHGILFSNGETWKEMRRFALTTLRDFGMGKRVAEEKILEECGHLIQMFENYKGEPFNTSCPLNYATSNIISSIVYGSRFEYDDPRFRKLVSRANETIRITGSAEIQDPESQTGDLDSRVMKILVTKGTTASDPASTTIFLEGTEILQGLDVPRACALLMGLIYALNLSYPRELKYTCELYNMFPRLVGWIKGRQVILKNVEMTKRDVKDLIKQLKETLKPQMCRGLVDCFLIRKQKEEDSCRKDTQFTEENLIFSVTNLFSAGTDTTAATLRWGLLLMAKYPHIQDRVQEELAKVIGSCKVRVEERKDLPYTDAVIHEIQRLANIVPLNNPHRTSQDVTFQGYFIKKGTTVFPLLTSVLNDESEWESPHSFNPSHFLNKEGKFIKRDAFLPFSAGRRVCVGEGLAKMELFLLFTSLLQRFRFTPPPGVTEDELDLTPAVGFTVPPSPHKLCAISRQ